MAENVILAEQYLDGFSYDEHTGYYVFADETGWFSLEEGVVYHIVWDGVDYYLTSYGIVLDEYEHIAVGNEAFVKGESTTVIEPFVVLYRPAHDWAFILSADDSAAHNVGIYQVIEDEEPETPEGIILRDYKGEETTHYGMEMLEVDTTDGGTELYVRNDLIATPVETTVVLDFSTGDMEVTPADGQVFSKVIIPVPENLKPENIPKDENIAGVVGTLAGGSNVKAITKFVTLPDYTTNSIVELISAAELAEAGLTFPSAAYCFAMMFVPDRLYEMDSSNRYATYVAMCAITNRIIGLDNKTTGDQGNEYGFLTTHQMQSGGYHYIYRYGIKGNYFTSAPTNGLCYTDGAIKFVVNSSTRLKKTYIVVAGYIENT